MGQTELSLSGATFCEVARLGVTASVQPSSRLGWGEPNPPVLELRAATVEGIFEATPAACQGPAPGATLRKSEATDRRAGNGCVLQIGSDIGFLDARSYTKGERGMR